MRRRLSIGITAILSVAAASLVPAAAEARHDHDGPRGWERGERRGPGFYHRGDGYYRQGPGGPRRSPRGYYGRPHRCRDTGAGGTILGAIAGGLLGDTVAGRGDRTTGAIVGGGLGALAGRAIDRDC